MTWLGSTIEIVNQICLSPEVVLTPATSPQHQPGVDKCSEVCSLEFASLDLCMHACMRVFMLSGLEITPLNFLESYFTIFILTILISSVREMCIPATLNHSLYSHKVFST